MIKTLHIENFTVFSNADFAFSEGLNIIVGENGTGKSHIIKLAHAALRALPEENEQIHSLESDIRLANSLMQTFCPKDISQLKRLQKNGSPVIRFTDTDDASFEFIILTDKKELQNEFKNERENRSNNGKETGTVTGTGTKNKTKTENETDTYLRLPSVRITQNEHFNKLNSIFIPPKEILSVYRGFRSALKNRELEFDATYLDLAEALDRTPYKGEKLKSVEHLYRLLENTINAKVTHDEGGSFCFSVFDSFSESSIVQSASMFAEGHRKLGMLAYLIKNGSIAKGSILFWDEPEANLNPGLIKKLAAVLVALSRDVQIVLATHSLFLLRELEILQLQKKLRDIRYFGLHFSDDGVTVQQGNTSNDIGDIASLDASIEQSECYMEITSEEF